MERPIWIDLAQPDSSAGKAKRQIQGRAVLDPSSIFKVAAARSAAARRNPLLARQFDGDRRTSRTQIRRIRDPGTCRE
jgi:hypothetical protein